MQKEKFGQFCCRMGDLESFIGGLRACQKIPWYGVITLRSPAGMVWTTAWSYSSISSKASEMTRITLDKIIRKIMYTVDVFRHFFLYISAVPHSTFWSESDIIEKSATRSRIIFCSTARRKWFSSWKFIWCKRNRYEYSHRLEVSNRHICSFTNRPQSHSTRSLRYEWSAALLP